MEQSVLDEVSKCCLFYHVKSTNQNIRSKENSLILSIRENPEFDEDFEEINPMDWHTIKFKKDKVKVLKAKEGQFKKGRMEGTESQLNIYFLVKHYPNIFKPNYYLMDFNEEEI